MIQQIIFKYVVLAGILLVPLAALSAEESSHPKQTTLLLQWSHQAQFAGYYMAEKKGYYRQYGLDLRIIEGGPDKVVSDYLDSGKADFGSMFLSTALERRDSGLQLVNIGQIVHHSSLMLIAKKNEIQSIADLDNKKVSLWANEFQIQPRMLFSEANINVEIVPLATSMDLFLRGAVSATACMWYNEYHTILSSGVRKSELQPFFFKNSSFDFPEDGLYCLKKTYEQSPERTQKLLLATLEGWRYAFSHEEETLDVVAKKMADAGRKVNRVHQRWMLRRMNDIMHIDRTGTVAGILDTGDYKRVIQLLYKGKIIHTPIPYDVFYKGAKAR